MRVQEELMQFILRELASDRAESSLAPDQDLISLGLIDSHAVVQLAAFVSERFGVEIEDEDLVPENFESVDTLSQLVERRRR